MTTETMTITRALAELKSIKARFQANVNDAPMALMSLGQGDRRKVVNSTLTPDKAEEWIKSKFQSIEDMLRRHKSIKEQIVLSNASTLVKIGGIEMTVAAAIERKTSIEMDKLVLHRMMQYMNQATAELKSAETRLSQDIERALATLFGSDRTKITEEQVKVVTDQKRVDFEPSIIDPIGLSAKIEQYTESIEKFLLEVNFSLSESNARTEITVEY